MRSSSSRHRRHRRQRVYLVTAKTEFDWDPGFGSVHDFRTRETDVVAPSMAVAIQKAKHKDDRLWRWGYPHGPRLNERSIQEEENAVTTYSVRERNQRYRKRRQGE